MLSAAWVQIPSSPPKRDAVIHGVSFNMESYRSGHNGAVLKTVRRQRHRGSNPLLSASSEIPLTAPLPPCGESYAGRGISSLFEANPLRWASLRVDGGCEIPLTAPFPPRGENSAGRGIFSFFEANPLRFEGTGARVFPTYRCRWLKACGIFGLWGFGPCFFSSLK